MVIAAMQTGQHYTAKLYSVELADFFFNSLNLVDI